ncbi:DUF3299 domain-containing protein [Thioalkalicoccus limnaeus]|uniref:DUF3299 domain-containing protein n=1 Tax=Thioalkalicoccus limnaeus TaxID=120681 RepID=A0ABV4BDM5_9GAMM
MTTRRLLLFAATLLMLAACGDRDGGQMGRGEPAGDIDETVETIDWDALIPEDWRPETLFAGYDIDEIDDEDPLAQTLMDKLLALWREAPIVPELDGRRIRLPGFVVPLEGDGVRIWEFLLVPYFGACIHVPPPPANQTVHVVTEPERGYRGALFDTVWVAGTIRVVTGATELAEAGYRIDAMRVTPYVAPGVRDD